MRAHGYLMHQFLSPLSNRRNDGWGGDFDGRTRIVTETVAAPCAPRSRTTCALAIRVSHTDWVEGGWTTEETRGAGAPREGAGHRPGRCLLRRATMPRQKIALGPGYQVPGAAAVRAARRAGRGGRA